MKFFAAEIDSSIVSIDLHVYHSIDEALDYMESALFRFANSGESYCRIIHGIGTGKMKHAVHKALEKNPMIIDYKMEEQGGSTIVLL